MKKTRFLMVNGTLWGYKVGKSYVNFFAPWGKRYNVCINEVSGLSPGNIEALRKDKKFAIMPQRVYEFIEERFELELQAHIRSVR